MLKDLSTRVHSFNEKIYKWAEKGDLEDTEAAGYCGSLTLNQGAAM